MNTITTTNTTSTHIYFLTHIYMKSKNVVQLHEVNTHTKESIKTTRSKCGGLFVRINFHKSPLKPMKNNIFGVPHRPTWSTWSTWPTWPPLGPHLAHLVPLGPHLGPTWSALGPTWPSTWSHLAPTWSHLVPTWSPLGPIWSSAKELEFFFNLGR